MKKTERFHHFPWLLVTFLCLYIGLTAFAVTALPHKTEKPELPSTQPTVPAPAEPDPQGVFDRLFAQPDWPMLYELAGENGNQFEGATTYGIYMQAKVGSQHLTYQEVHTDLPDTHRYLVYLGDEKIAVFTMGGSSDWKLNSLELFYEPTVSVTVEALPEHTVYVNGIALDDSYTIRTLQTIAEEYLTEGVHGYRRKWQAVSGLLVEPQIRVVDVDGMEVALERDSETGVYRPVADALAGMTEAEAVLARNAAIADARYAIGAISNVQLKESFDANSAVYKMLITNPRNLQKYTSASIDEKTIEVSEFCRYSDTLFSVNVKLTQQIIRTTGTLKIYQLDKTYFFTLIDGNYLVTDYTNQHVTDRVEQVRLAFEGGSSMMADVSAAAVAVPPVENEDFLGWASRTVAEDGTVCMQVRILPYGTVLGHLEPMVLYPVFQTP